MENKGVGCLFTLVFVLAVLSFSFTGYNAGFRTGIDEERKKAIAAGAGRWTVDPQTGEKQFEYRKE